MEFQILIRKTAKKVHESPVKLTDTGGAKEVPKSALTGAETGRKVHSRKGARKPEQTTRRDRDDGNRKRKKKPKIMLFHINCDQPAQDDIFDVNDFEEFLKARFKVDGRVNNLSRAVTIASAGNKITVTTRDLHFSKRYLKYLSKKYLQKKGLRDWLRVVSPVASGGDTYDLRYYKFADLEDSEDDEES